MKGSTRSPRGDRCGFLRSRFSAWTDSSGADGTDHDCDVSRHETGIALYWLPLGAGGHSVRWNGRIFEWIAAGLGRRRRCDLYHSVPKRSRVLGFSAATPSAHALLELVPLVPTPVWGRDELQAGEMWNSNSVIAWLLATGGFEVDSIRPPAGGRAPGWAAGITVARRCGQSDPRRPLAPSRQRGEAEHSSIDAEGGAG